MQTVREENHDVKTPVRQAFERCQSDFERLGYAVHWLDLTGAFGDDAPGVVVDPAGRRVFANATATPEDLAPAWLAAMAALQA